MNTTRSAYLDWLASVMTTSPRPAAGTAPQDDLVLGYATGYGVAEIAPFVRSLREVFDGDVALVVDPRPDLLRFLRDHRVDVVEPDRCARSWSPHPVVERFAAYAACLETRPCIRHVILTDVRDVVFQADPFTRPFDRLEFFEENEGRPLRSHAFNVKHLRALAGEKLMGGLADQACVCVGVVGGPRADVIRFCRALLMLCAIPRSGVGGAFGADQAACNLIAHLGLVEGDIRPNFERVATIGLTPSERLRLDDGVIINPDNTISPIVHQYDRVRHLEGFVHHRWGEPQASQRTKSPFRRRRAVLAASLRRRLPEWR